MVAFRDYQRHEVKRLRNGSFVGGSLRRRPTKNQELNHKSDTGQFFLANRDRGMASIVIRNAPYNVLVILAEGGLDVANILPALKPHFALVCTSPEQGIEAARQFEPDVVLIDVRTPDPSAIIREVSQVAGGRNIVFVSMAATSELRAVPAGFERNLPMPATAGEMERLLWKIGRDLAARPAGVRFPDSEMIG